MLKKIVFGLLSLGFFFAGATVASAQPVFRTPAACNQVFMAGSCADRVCSLVRSVQGLDLSCPGDPVAADAARDALVASYQNLASECNAEVPAAVRRTADALMADLDRLCRRQRVTLPDGTVVTPPPRRVSIPSRPRERGRDRETTPPRIVTPPQSERQAVVCHTDLGAVSTADGQSCQCRQERYLDGVPVVGVLVNIPQRFSDARHFGCPDRSREEIDRILMILQQRAAAQDARDRAQDASIRRAQGTAEQAGRAAANAREIAERALRERPSSIEERFHIDLLGRARLVIPGQVGGGAPVAGGAGLGLRFRWRCNICSSRDEFYFAVAGGGGYTGQSVGGTAFGEMGIGYTRYLDTDRVFGLSVGVLAYGFGLMGQEAAPTEPGLHGDLRRWGVGGEILLDISLTGGSVANRPRRTEVRLQLGLGLTYDTAFWWSAQAGLMQSQGVGFAPTIGLIINP
jgi:hypothetical protein